MTLRRFLKEFSVVLILLPAGKGVGCVSSDCAEGMEARDGKCVAVESDDAGASGDIDGSFSDSPSNDASRGVADAGVDAGFADAGAADPEPDAGGSPDACDPTPVDCYVDEDGDAYAPPAAEVRTAVCGECPEGTTARTPLSGDRDCDDGAPEIHPTAAEGCDGVDQDCDNRADESAGASCPFDNGAGVCMIGAVCVLGDCDSGYGDCDDDDESGCEQQLNVDAHCGGCGVVCDMYNGRCVGAEGEEACECASPTFGSGTECRVLGPLAAGPLSTCGIRAGGIVDCWGVEDDSTDVRAAARFEQIALGQTHGCGVLLSSAMECWGSNANGQLDAPSEADFVQVVVGKDHSCGLHGDGTVSCWGVSQQSAPPAGTDFGQSLAPTGTFRFLAAGDQHTCGIREDRTVECWGRGLSTGGTCEGNINDDCAQTEAPAGEFTKLAAGAVHTCGIRTTGSISCWGAGTTDVGSVPAFGQSDPPSGVFLDIVAGSLHNCAIAFDGDVECWGAGEPGVSSFVERGQADAPAMEFTHLTAGFTHTCGLTTGGDAACWGSSDDGQAPAIVGGPFPVVLGEE